MALEEPRRGARRPELVDSRILHALNVGSLATVNLMEVIAVDQVVLMRHLLPDRRALPPALSSPRLLQRMVAGATVLLETFGDDLWNRSQTWTSDVARGWAAMAVGLYPDLAISERLVLAARYATDGHFAVREWAWLGIRGELAMDVHTAMAQLSSWVIRDDPNLRRFASEATRPIGVWSRHIPLLKEDPQLGLPVLEPLRSDASRYVRQSVGNWLNDAARTRPDWVRSVCERWATAGGSAEIRKRAMRRVCLL